MNDLTIYCMSIHPKNLNTIKELNYIPVGLYNENFSNEWMRDNTGDNISKKNPYYGEYTFYYWYWTTSHDTSQGKGNGRNIRIRFYLLPNDVKTDAAAAVQDFIQVHEPHCGHHQRSPRCP